MSSEISGSASQETNFITYYLEECGVMEVLNNEWFTTLALSIIATAGLTIYLTTTISASLACLGVCILSAPFALNCCYDLFVESTENPVTRMDNPTQNNIITTPAIVDSFDLVDSIEHYQTTLRLNQQHFADSIAFEREGISFPDGVDPDSIDYAQLITLADQINTSDDAREDYIPPAQATQDDPTYDQTGRVIRQNWMTIEQVRSGIATFVNCIQRRTAIAGISGMTPDQNRDFFNTIENYAKFVTYSLYQDQHNADPRVRNSNLLRIGVIAQHCVGRYMKGLTEMYQDLSGNIRITTLDDEIKEAYHERRQGLINHLITEHIRVHPGDGGMFMSHTQNDFAKFIGRARGVVGSRAAEFADPYTRRINENAAITSFDALYTPAFILQRGSWMLNGLVDTRNENQDPSMRIHRTFDTDQINSWFQNHIPDGWEPRQGLPEGMANMDRGDLFRMSCIDHHGLVKKCAIEYMLTHLDILQGDLDVSQIQVDHATLEMLCLV